ncbi:MAG: natural product biosynthesis luciferase-like monooxygenase protein [Myxococcota bacterium]|jgi:natural product biosynthesis luciferase-like monooxygenase protein
MSKSLPNPSLSCVLVGSESLLIQCGEILLEKGGEVRAVVSRNPQILEWGTAKSIPTFAPGKTLADSLRPLPFDYFFSITNLAMISDEVLAMATKASINFHDGPLPRYAGMYTPAWAILGGETEYGVSFHEMTTGADEGGIYAQRHFAMGPDETSLTLNTRCYEAAIDGFTELIDGLANESIATTPQNLDERTYYERYRRPDAAGTIDWRRPAPELAASVRAMDFGRYENAFGSAKIIHQGVVCLVGGAEVREGSGDAGTVLSIGDDAIVVAAGDGDSLALSRFTCPKGVELTPAQAAARMSIAVGELFVGLDDGTRVRLTSRNAITTPSEAFWVRRLRELDTVEIPYRSSASGADAEPQFTSEPIEVPAGIADLGTEDPTATLIAAFVAYLSRVSGKDTFDIALDDAAQRAAHAGLEAFYSTSLPLRIAIDREGTAAAAIEKVSLGVAVARERGSFLNDVIARYPELSGGHLVANNVLAPIAVVTCADPSNYTPTDGTDIALVMASDGGSVQFHYDTRVLSSESVASLRTQFETFLTGLGGAEGLLARVPLLEASARETILREWNNTAVDFDRGQCIHELFEARVAATPDATAIVYEANSLSYRELDDRANQLAHHLRDLGIGPDKLVGVYLERSLDMMIGIMGVLKAGGAYVPLDPTYPLDRIAYMIEDSGVSVILAQERLLESVPSNNATVVVVDRDRAAITANSNEPLGAIASPENLSYVIYTSGSTGNPKGVMVEHRNVVNFFVGMDERIPHDPPGSWLAVTSLSFDISVLELLWTLARGFKVVVHADSERKGGAEKGPWKPVDFGLAMWGSDAGPGPKKYELMLESAKFGDQNGFSSFQTPERHFGAFGGPFPNPAVTGAAIAAVTERIRIRAGSCVLPLHHPIRVAEDYAVVDNLSNGRAEISFASGWQPNDFVIRPGAFKTAKTGMFEGAAQVQALWRGEAVEFENPMGDMVPTATLPRPVQKELPSWFTTAGNIQSFESAGAAGFNIFTHLLGQDLDELAAKIKVYRRARAAAGHDPEAGVVTLMLHTFVGEDNDAIRELVRGSMKEYLGAAMKLVIGFAWSFPAFDRPGGPDSKPEDVDLASLTEEEADTILEFAFERYYETSGLFGTQEMCAEMVDRVKDAGISEICCLIDYGLPTDIVLDSLPALNELRKHVNEQPPGEVAVEVGAEAESVGNYSFEAQIAEHAISHVQCTPSHAKMLVTNPDTAGSLGDVAHMMIGGEAFPVSLAAELDGVAGGTVTNMYGPTETTIWSSTEAIVGSPDVVSIGKPIANTQLYILDAGQEPLPVGIPGELLIGGEGVVRGYLHRPELTDDRFIPDPFSDAPGARMYRTGDLARWNADGTIDFLGRMDHQVKIRGYRIELGEIETRLGQQPGIRECVVVAREDTPGDIRLVAYMVPDAGPLVDATLRDALRENLPDFMVPSLYVELERFPMTPNGKIDRKAMPAPDQIRARVQAEYKAPGNELEQQITNVWKDVLYLENVGTNDNFFDLGGHSLLVVQAHRKLREACEHKISLTDLYRFPTIAGLANFLTSGGDGAVQAKQSQDRGAKRREAMGKRRRRGR